MEIKHAEFVTSAVNAAGLPTDGLPEFLFCGRSNVGKSSMINLLCNRKSLARTSQTPGKTQTLNIFKLNKSFYFVDVPGYGYAAKSKSIISTFGKMIETYVKKREELKIAFLLVDSRHKPSADDCLMHEFLHHYVDHIIVIATKCDKLNSSERAKSKKVIRETLKLEEEDKLIYASVLKRLGIKEILDEIEKML